MSENFEWYLPSWYGDIRLRVIDEHHTRVEVTALTQGELFVMRALKKRSLQKSLLKRPWATDKAWRTMPDDAFVIGDKQPRHVILKAPITVIERFLTRQLRGRTDTVSVMITEQGNLYEIKVPENSEVDTNVLPFRREAGDEPAAATTVRKPAIGCPAPDFEHAHVRATEVLRRFLTPQQVADYEKHQRFLTYGGATGKRYMLMSRHALSTKGDKFRTVYGVDDGHYYCVHDWGIPAPEELLTMHLMLSLPEYEGYVCGLGEAQPDPLNKFFNGRTGTMGGVLRPPEPHYYYDANGCLRAYNKDKCNFEIVHNDAEAVYTGVPTIVATRPFDPDEAVAKHKARNPRRGDLN